MKLHLPKPLLLAVLACFVAPASWAADAITIDNGTYNGADCDLTDVYNTSNNRTFIRAAGIENGNGTAVTDSIGTLTLKSGLDNVVIAGTWNSTGSYFESLTIGTLQVGDGTGNVNLQIGTEQGNNTAANNVVINGVSGNISGLTLDNKSSLTIVGAPHFATGVALQLKEGSNLILNNAGEITMRTGAAAGDTDGAIKAQGSGTLTIGSGTTVTFANAAQQKVAPVEGHVVVNGGGVLKLTGAKSLLGYDEDKLDTLTLAGTSADNLAKLDIQTTENQHLSTNVYMNGHALIAGSNGVIETYDGSITATGVNNKIESKLNLNRALTINVTNAADHLTVSGTVTYSSHGLSLTKGGAGTLVFSGVNNVFNSQYKHNAGITEINGTSTFTNGIALKGGEVKVGAAATLKGKSTVADGSTLTVTSAGQLTFADGGTLELSAAGSVLDLTDITYFDANVNNDGVNQALVNLMNQTSGAGTVKLNGGSVIQTTEHVRHNVNLGTNYVVGSSSSDSLTLTAWSTGSWRTWTVLEGGSLTVGGGAGMLNVRAGQQLIIQDGGKVHVGQLMLGHEAAENPGSVVMNGKDSQLTVSQFYGNATKDDWNNKVDINGGILTITGDTAFAIKSGSYMDVSIEGGADSPVVLKTASTDVLMSGDSTSLNGGTFKIANVTVDAANTNTITIKDATLGAGIINNGKLALGGTITISDQYAYTMTSMGEAEGTYSLGNGNGFYTATGIQYELVGGTGTNTLLEGVSATFGGDSTTLSLGESGNVVFTVTGESTTREFFINKGTVDVAGAGSTTTTPTGAIKYIVGTNGTLNLTDGSLETSIIENNGAVNLGSADAKLIVNTDNAASYLTETTGTGTMELQTDVTLSDNSSVAFCGSLDIESGATLTLGRVYDSTADPTSSNKTEYDINISSLSSLNLNGGTLNMYYVAPHIKSMTVETASTIYIDDVWADRQTAKDDATLIDSLQLDADLTMHTNWKSNVNIGVLSGAANLTAKQTNGSEGSTSNLWIDGVNNYTGTISLSGKMALTLNIGDNQSLNASQLSVGSDSTATLTGSGEYNLGSTSSLGSGVSLSGDSWTGTVSITGAASDGADLSLLGNASSKIAINGLSGWIQRRNIMSLIDLGTNGMTLTAYSTTGTYDFAGGVSGAGNIVLDSSSAASPHFNIGSNGTSGWEGGFVVNNMAAGQTVELKMVGGGELMAAGSKGIQMNSNTGTLSFVIGNSDVVTTMNGAVSNTGTGTLNMTVQGDTEFKAGVNMSQLSMSGTGVDVTLSGADNTIGGDLSIANGNSLTLAKDSKLTVNSPIQNDGNLDIKGTVHWNLASTEGLTVTYAESELTRTTNGLGSGVVSGLITGNGTLKGNGTVAASYNDCVGSLDTQTGLFASDSAIYYVVAPAGSADDTYKYSMFKEVINSADVVYVGVHTYPGPIANEEANNALGFYVGENGILGIIGDSNTMTSGQILAQTQGEGTIILRAPGTNTEQDANGLLKNLYVTVDSKTQFTGRLSMATQLLKASTEPESTKSVHLYLEEGADVSSFSNIEMANGSYIHVNGPITRSSENVGHFNNVSSIGGYNNRFNFNSGSSGNYVFGGDTLLLPYAHGLSQAQGVAMDIHFYDNVTLDIEHLTSQGSPLTDKMHLRFLNGEFGINFNNDDVKEYYSTLIINTIVNVKSFDYEGSVGLETYLNGHLHANINLLESQKLKQSQYYSYIGGFAKNYTDTAPTLTITGFGTYILTEGNSILDNFGIVSTAFAEDGSRIWQGTVEVNRLEATDGMSAGSTKSGFDFADYGNESSTVHFKGFKGYLYGGTIENNAHLTVNIEQDLILTNVPEKSVTAEDGTVTTMPAMNGYEISDGFTGQEQTYKGSISGDGDFVVSAADGMTFNLQGDVSEWKGGAELKVTNGTHNVNFSNAATEINADVLATGGTMNTTISNAAAVTVNGKVAADGGTLNLSVNTAQGTTFTNNVEVTKLAVGSGSTAKLQATSSAGNIKIDSYGEVDSYGEGKVATLSNGLTMEGDVVSSGQIADAMITQLQKQGSVELQDVTASNLYLYGNGVKFHSTDTKNQFTFDKQISYGNESVNEVVFTSDIFRGMILSEDGAQLTLTVNNAVVWDDAEQPDWTNVTIKLNGFTIEQLAGKAGDWYWDKFGLSIEAVGAEAAMLAADGLSTDVTALLNADYQFVEYVQDEYGLTIRMYNTPEPTTATLSMLALAALAARRRRR